MTKWLKGARTSIGWVGLEGLDSLTNTFVPVLLVTLPQQLSPESEQRSEATVWEACHPSITRTKQDILVNRVRDLTLTGNVSQLGLGFSSNITVITELPYYDARNCDLMFVNRRNLHVLFFRMYCWQRVWELTYWSQWPKSIGTSKKKNNSWQTWAWTRGHVDWQNSIPASDVYF